MGRWAGTGNLNSNTECGENNTAVEGDDLYVPAPMHAVYNEAFYSRWATPVELEMKKKPQQRDYDMIAEKTLC